MQLNIDDTYAKNGTFLKAADLEKRRVNLTIAGASLQDMKDGSKIVLDFEATEKQLVLNKTNANMICDLLGSRDAMTWIGSTIALRPDKTQMQDGKIVDCIRVDFELPPQKIANSLGARAIAVNPAVAQPVAAMAAPSAGGTVNNLRLDRDTLVPIAPEPDDIPF